MGSFVTKQSANPGLSQPLPYFTRKRVRGHGLLLAVALWSLYAANLAHPGLRDWFGHMKGGDFVHEYVLGKIALARNASMLFDYQGQIKVSRQAIPGIEDESYLPIYGPQVSLLYLPFAMLRYLWAAVLWALFSSAIYAACCYAVWRTTPNLQKEGSTVLILAIGFPAYINLIEFGQNSAIGLSAFVLAYLGLRNRKPFFAGMALGLLFYKPQLGIVAAIVFALTMDWRVILGGIVTTAIQVGTAWVYYGKNSLLDYFHAMQNLGQNAKLLEPKLYIMYSLRSFWQMLLPWPTIALFLYIMSSILVLILLFKSWLSPQPLSLRYAALLLATVLVDPHISSYDLVLLAPAFLLIGDQLLGTYFGQGLERVRWLVYLSYALPLIGPTIQDLRVQVAVPVFCLLFLAIVLDSSRKMNFQVSDEPGEIHI
jgi:hypothetical protein